MVLLVQNNVEGVKKISGGNPGGSLARIGGTFVQELLSKRNTRRAAREGIPVPVARKGASVLS